MKPRTSVLVCVLALPGIRCMTIAERGAQGQVQSQAISYTGQPVDANRVFRSFERPVINDDGHVLFVGATAFDTPANDDCGSAIEIFQGLTSFGNHFATTTVMPAWCGQLDAWYTFVAPRNEVATIRVVCSGSIYPNTRLQLYRGTCGALTLIGTCLDSTGSLTLEAGLTYYLRVGTASSPSNPTNIRGTTTITFLSAGTPQSPPASANPDFDSFLFINRGMGNEPILHEGDATSFDPALSYRGFSFAALGGADRLAVPAVARSANLMEPTLLSLASGVAGGELVQEVRDTPAWQVPIPRLTIDGATAYAENTGVAIVVGPRAVVSTFPAPGTPSGVTFNFLDEPVVAGRAFSFRSTLAGPGVTDLSNMGIWTDLNNGPSAGPMLVARLGDAAPGMDPGVVFASLPLQPAVTDTGVTAIVAGVSGGGVTPENDTGVWRGGPGFLALLTRTGHPAPGVDGAAFREFSPRLGINRAGDLLVRAHVAGDGIDATNDSGLWFSRLFGPLQLLAREGAQAPGLSKGVVFHAFAEPVLGTAGDIAYIARLRGPGVDRSSNEALFLRTKDGRTRLVIRRGDLISLPDGSNKTVRAFSFGAGVGAGHQALNFSSQLAFTVDFTDFTQAIIVTERPCDADWNHSGTVSSEDFFAFLEEYFTDAGDINRDGFSNSQDFFDFLAALFEPCE